MARIWVHIGSRMQLMSAIPGISFLLGVTEGRGYPHGGGSDYRPVRRRVPCQRYIVDWWGSLLRTGWSVFPKTNSYLRGFWRSDSNHLWDESVVRLEKGWCCDAVLPQYADQTALYLSSSCTSDLLIQFFTPLGGALGFFSVLKAEYSDLVESFRSTWATSHWLIN